MEGMEEIEGIREGSTKRCPGGTRDSPKVDEGVPTKGAEGDGNASER